MEAFPAFFPLAGKRVVIAGDGEQAEAKLRLFEGSPATVDHLTGPAALEASSYAGAALAFVASPDPVFRKAAAVGNSTGPRGGLPKARRRTCRRSPTGPRYPTSRPCQPPRP